MFIYEIVLFIRYLRMILKMSIKINTSLDKLFDEYSLKRLRESYMMPGETTPQQRLAYVCKQLGSNEQHAQRLYDYSSNHLLAFSTPILSLGKAKNGLPISCYLAYLEDTSKGLIDTLSEVNQLSMMGGGVGIGVNLRSSDEKSTGVMPHMKTYDSCCLAYKQDGVRRGSYAVYLNVDHPEIIPFIEMRKQTGDHNIRCLNIHHGINFSDKFMKLIEKCENEGESVDDSWPLIDPHTKLVKKIVSARALWQLYLTTRLRTGEPYQCHIDICNRLMPEFQRSKGLKISQSNLCVVGSTLILTDIGNIEIDKLVNKYVNVWNGDSYSNVLIVKTGTDKKLVTITTDKNRLTCTRYHKFILADNLPIIMCKRVDAQNLVVGTILKDGQRVEKVLHLKTRADVYCFKERKNNAGVFNGILTGNCTEIILPTNKDRTAVCCISSVNIEKYSQWKHNNLFIRDVAEMLDNALIMFQRLAPDSLKRAKYSALQENSIGIGVLGWHAYLQSLNVSIESDEAKRINIEFFQDFNKRINDANLQLGRERGEPNDAKGTGRRFSCTIAIAPNATSSIIMGNTSPGIEPFRANAYRQDTLSGANLNRNVYLERLLESKGINNKSTWMNILLHKGSVQHMSELTIHEKNVYKTAFEIDQNVLLKLASDRQKFIDQSQSLNLFILPTISVQELHSLHLNAWKLGLKTLYYCRSTKIVSADTLNIDEEIKTCSRKEGCIACE